MENSGEPVMFACAFGANAAISPTHRQRRRAAGPKSIYPIDKQVTTSNLDPRLADTASMCRIENLRASILTAATPPPSPPDWSDRCLPSSTQLSGSRFDTPPEPQRRARGSRGPAVSAASPSSEPV
jgi:hypothetical protein